MLRQTLNEISTIVADNKGNISLVQQTADKLATRISNAEGDISTVEQTADKINWIVRSGTSASNFELTSRMAKLVAAEVDITGFVTFNDLERKGRTAINGGNITTGTIDADSVTLGSSYGGFECASGNDGKTTTTGAKMYGATATTTPCDGQGGSHDLRRGIRGILHKQWCDACGGLRFPRGNKFLLHDERRGQPWDKQISLGYGFCGHGGDQHL